LGRRWFQTVSEKKQVNRRTIFGVTKGYAEHLQRKEKRIEKKSVGRKGYRIEEGAQQLNPRDHIRHA